MLITKTALAGTMESSDIMITLEPWDGGIEIDLSSTVEKRFGKEIFIISKDQNKHKSNKLLSDSPFMELRFWTRAAKFFS